MAIADEFNGILRGRIQFEKRTDVPDSFWGRPQYRDALGSVAYDSELKALAAQTEATALLSAAWETYRDESESDPLLAKLRGSVEKLFSTAQGSLLDEMTVRTRFTTFATEAAAAVKSLESESQPHGMILNINVALSGVDAIYPELSLLDDQRKALLELIKKMGRQTDTKSWSEWFAQKFATVKNSIPALAEMSVWTGISAVINRLLDVGLIGYSIADFSGNVITFGANVLAPWQATLEFPKFMNKQLVLYRLKEYGEKTLSQHCTSKVMTAIQSAINLIDWAAVKMAFKVTPFGLLISAYSGVKFIVTKAKPSVGAYYSNAKDLIDVADTIHTDKETPENKLAMLTILHLAGSLDKFVEIITCRKDDAYSALSGLMDI